MSISTKLNHDLFFSEKFGHISLFSWVGLTIKMTSKSTQIRTDPRSSLENPRSGYPLPVAWKPSPMAVSLQSAYSRPVALDHRHSLRWIPFPIPQFRRLLVLPCNALFSTFVPLSLAAWPSRTLLAPSQVPILMFWKRQRFSR